MSSQHGLRIEASYVNMTFSSVDRVLLGLHMAMGAHIRLRSDCSFFSDRSTRHGQDSREAFIWQGENSALVYPGTTGCCGPNIRGISARCYVGTLAVSMATSQERRGEAKIPRHETDEESRMADRVLVAC
jgi:hypothetical protein